MTLEGGIFHPGNSGVFYSKLDHLPSENEPVDIDLTPTLLSICFIRLNSRQAKPASSKFLYITILYIRAYSLYNPVHFLYIADMLVLYLLPIM